MLGVLLRILLKARRPELRRVPTWRCTGDRPECEPKNMLGVLDKPDEE